MTANVDFTVAKKMIDEKEIRKSIETVDYHIEKLEESFDQLESIYRLNVSPEVRKAALKYLAKQEKLISIANDLKTRFQSLRPLRIIGAEKITPDYDVQQLLIELDLLNEMHFRVKKSYFSFVDMYFNKKRPVGLMVA